MVESKAAKFDRFLELWRQDFNTNTERHDACRRWFKWYFGEQWDNPGSNPGNKFTFNRIKPAIDAICGSQVSNPRTVLALARTVEQTSKSDTMNDILRWFRTKAEADSTEAEVFRDALVSGLGFFKVALDWELEPDGAPVYEYLNPLEMYIPAVCRRANAADAKYMFRLTWHTEDDLIERFGRGHADHNEFGFPVSSDNNGRRATYGSSKRGRGSGAGENEEGNKQYALAELRIMEPAETVYLTRQGVVEGSSREALLAAGIAEGDIVEIRRKRPHRYWLGNNCILEDSPVLAADNSLGWYCVSGWNSPIACEYKGVVEQMTDSQHLINRALSQTIYLFDRTAKGGLFAEAGAFEDAKKAEAAYAKNDEIIFVKPGALSAGRLQPRAVQEVPQTLPIVLDRVEGLFNQVSGISAEFMGTREAEQANVLEQTRRQSTLNVLAVVFNNLKNARIAAGKGIVYLAQNWLPENILLADNDNSSGRPMKQVRREDFAGVDYDVYLSDAPNGEDEKAATFAKLQAILPIVLQMKESGIGDELIKTALKYSPLPAQIVQEAISVMNEEAGQQAETEGMQQQMQQAAEQQQFKTGMSQLQADEAKAEVEKQQAAGMLG